MDIKTNLSISKPSGGGEAYIEICIQDEASRIAFATVKLGLKDFAEAITGLGGIKCTTEVRGLAFVGKRKEVDRGSVFISDEDYHNLTDTVNYHRREGVLADWLEANATREGWMIGRYLGSRDSIKHVEGGRQINFNYYRYV